MLRGLCTLEMRIRFEAIAHAPRAVYSACALTLRPSRIIQGSRTLRMHPHFEAIPHHPRVAKPQNAPSPLGYPECSEGRVSSECALTYMLPRTLRELV